MADDRRDRIVAAYRQWAESYDRLMRRTYQRVERAITRRHLLAYLPERNDDATLVDVGGGDARQAIPLLAAGRAGRAVVVDLSGDMLSLAAQRSARAGARVDLVRGDAAELPMPRASCDVALLLGGVLSHGGDPTAALAEMRRVLRRGGYAAISVDNLSVGVRTACRERDPVVLDALLRRGIAAAFHQVPFPIPVRFFTPDEIRNAVERAGFTILSMIGKPVFTHFGGPSEVLSAPEVEPRVDLEWPFVTEPRYWPFADQIELIVRG